MSGESPSEYELADVPEPEPIPPLESPPAPKPTPPAAPGQPLPRLWRTEPDDDEPAPAAEPPRSAPEPAPRRRPKPARTSKPSDEPGEKKGLIEATPALDTHEARQRGRLAVGVLILVIIGIGIRLVYQTLIYDPFPMDDVPLDDAAAAQGPVEPSLPRLDINAEARAMLGQARDAARAGKADAAVALLERLVATYKNTPAAVEAREALERPSRNLPLFLDRPTVEAASPPPPAPTPEPEPPAVVVARAPNAPTRGQATLAPPVNPAEPIVEPPPRASATLSAAEAPEQTLPPGFSARPEAGLDPSGWPLVIVGDRDGAPMVFVPGGVFTVGDDQDQQFASPAHKVRLSSYYIDQHEVTARQFHLFVSETNYRGRPPANWPPISEVERAAVESLPMVMVNVDDAQAYAEWAGKQLPTEAQWESAARSSDGRVYPWGNTPPSYARPRAPRQIDPVMTFPEDRSAYGVFDLAGNAMEWTADLFDPSYYRSIAGQITDDPTGARPRAGRSDQVVKGGKTGAAAAREPISPDKRLNYVGFRCVLQVERPAAPPTPTPVAAPEPPQSPVRSRRPAVSPQPVVPF